MNDEIKEILVLQNYVKRYKSDEKAIINHSRLTTPLMLDYLEVKNILDYITNLQHTEDLYNQLLKDYDELQERIEKADWWLREMLKQAKSDETKAIISGALELLS